MNRELYDDGEIIPYRRPPSRWMAALREGAQRACRRRAASGGRPMGKPGSDGVRTPPLGRPE